MPNLQRLVRSLPQRSLPMPAQTVLAAACVAAGTLVHWLLESALTNVPFITFFPAILVASVLGGMGAGVITLGLSAVVAGYRWLEPYDTFDLTRLSGTTLVVFLLMGGIVVLGVHLLQVAAAMARDSEARAGLIAREMQHRIGNKLALVQAVARLSARHSTTLDEFQEAFSARLRALSDSQAVVAPDPDLPTDLEALLKVVLRPFDEQRIDFFGPPAGIDHRDRPMLALLAHELATNAVKHGALSVPRGRIAVRWTVVDPGVNIEWREAGGPPVEPPSSTGFGTSLANAAFPPDRGEVVFAYRPDGLCCTVRMRAAGPLAAPTGRATAFRAGYSPPLKG